MPRFVAFLSVQQTTVCVLVFILSFTSTVRVSAESSMHHDLKTVAFETKLLALDGQSGDTLGWSVSLSGNRALVGAYLDDSQGSNAGAAYVFEYDGNQWNQVQKLVAADASAFDRFGTSVSLFANRALVGAPGDDDNGDESGSAYVFDFDGLHWNQSGKLTAADGAAFDEFADAVSLYGQRALIGAYLNDDNGNNSGSAYVFDFDGINWSQTQKLTAADAAMADNFGNAVSLYADSALIGAQLDDDNGSNSGSAYVFNFNGNDWNQIQKLMAADGAAFDAFAGAVSLFAHRAIVGAAGDDDNGENSGALYVFDYDGFGWNQTQKLLPTDGATQEEFGSSVSLVADRALIGTPSDDDNGNNSGSAYVFEFDGNDWHQTQKLTADNGNSLDNFGFSVSLSQDNALIGVPGDDDNGAVSGSAFVFVSDVIFVDGFEGL